MNKTKWIYFFSFLGIFVLMAIIGFSTAYFKKENKQVINNVASSLACLNTTIIDENASINIGNAIAIDDEDGIKTNPYTFTITNNCSTPVLAEINFEKNSDSTLSDGLIKTEFRLSGNTSNHTPQLLNSFGTNPPVVTGNTSYNLRNDVFLNANSSKTYSLKLWVDASATIEDLNKTFSGKIVINYVATKNSHPAPSGWFTAPSSTLLGNISGSSEISSIAPNEVKNLAFDVSMMGSAPDDYGTSYYYHGPADNNWVHFAGYYWRIVRINGDGSIRMVYSGNTEPTKEEAVHMTGTKTEIGQSVFNDLENGIQDSGYMFGDNNDFHGYTSDSSIKILVDNWYQNNLLSYGNYISDSIYCNDRDNDMQQVLDHLEPISYSDSGYVMMSNKIKDDSIIGMPAPEGSEWEYFVFTSYDRMHDGKPKLACTNKSDSFTVDDELKGNGALTYPVGLLTADDIMLSGGSYTAANNTFYYLYTGSPNYSMTPFNSSFLYTDETTIDEIMADPGIVRSSFFIIDSGGNTSCKNSAYSLGIRPVISLKNNVTATGTGVFNDPYEITGISS